MANSQAQNDSIANGKADAANKTAGSTAPQNPKSGQPAFVSGVAKQVDASHDTILYIAITTAAALKVEMGSTATTLLTIMPSQTAALGVVTLRVPAGWYVKVTGTIANLAFNHVTI